jgi:hypothetical protein
MKKGLAFDWFGGQSLCLKSLTEVFYFEPQD